MSSYLFTFPEILPLEAPELLSSLQRTARELSCIGFSQEGVMVENVGVNHACYFLPYIRTYSISI